MSKLLDTHEQFQNIKRSVSKAIQDSLETEGKKNRLVVKKVEVDDNLDPADLQSQLDAKLQQKTWGVPLYAEIELQDKKTGEKIDRQRIKLLDIPKLTPRYSFIVNGSEFQVSNQLRLKPGAYVRKQRTGETEAMINLERGKNFHLNLNPEKNKVYAEIGTAKVNVYSLFHLLGLKDKEMVDYLGADLHSALVTPHVDSDILKLHQSLFHEKEENVEKAIDRLREYFKDTKISPETTQSTLGRGYTHVTGDMMMRTVKKLIDVNRGTVEPDNRDELRFKKLMTPDDLLEQRITKNVRLIQSRLRPKVDVSTEVRQVIQPRMISKLIYAGRGEDASGSFYNSSSLSNNPTQTNPVDFLSGFSKVTYLGEGGIGDTHAITLQSRNINPTQIGFLDPVQTPENAEIGVVNHIPLGVSKSHGEMKTRVQTRKGEMVQLSAHDLYTLTSALPGEMTDKWKPIRGHRVQAYRAGKIVEVEPEEVTHRFVDASDLFGIAANMIPFMSANQGARAMMGAKMMEQAVPLIEREAPLVQSRLTGDVTTDRAVGQEFSVHSPVSGEVVSVGEGMLKIKDSAGKTHEVQYYHNFPMNSDVAIHSDPLVKKGDEVKKGQLLADTNFTRNGTLAIGKNLKVAYLPYKGYTFEDGVVISEAAAQKLTSEHMHRVESPRIRAGGVGTVYDVKKFASYYPTAYTSSQLGKLDDEGVVKPGQQLHPGDPVIVYMQEKSITPEDIAMGKLRKSLVKPYKDKSITWDFDDEGEVVRVSKTAEGPIVWVKTKESMKIGDKLAGRHGNKGVVTMIVPDREMPHTADGDPIDVILDPHGIPSRINVGQVFETVAGKIAKKTGKPYVVDNFIDGSYIENIQKDLAKAGLKDREKVIDPVTNEVIGKPLVGQQFIMKLRFPVRKKFSGRGTGKYTQDMIPAKGGDESAQSLDPLKMFSMIAHGANANIREMSTYKAQDNPEFWLALQNKRALPAPKPTFAWEKFVTMMRAAGVNVQKEGSTIRPIPITDDEILTLSSGAITDAKFTRAKDLRPEKGGLFDPVITGGVKGGRWAHIPLTESMANPLFEDAIRSITGLTQEKLDDIISGRHRVNHEGNVVDEEKLASEMEKDAAKHAVGGEALKRMLSKIDIDADLKKEEERAPGLRGADLNRANRKIRILRNLKDLGLRPEDAFLMNNISVIPPKFRPMYPDESGMIVESPINHLYKNLILVNRSLQDSKQLPNPEDRTKAREELYNAVKVFQGWAEPTGARKELMTGIFDFLASKGQPKGGFFQSKLLSKRQDVSGRSTIVLNPDLHMDEAGIPEEMAWKIFEPFIAQELVNIGYNSVDAVTMIRERDPRAESALRRAVDKRPILLNRAPSLHKHSILAFRPILIKGRSIELPPLVTKGFNADFDGDTMSVEVPVTQDAVEEAAMMFPSRNMLSTSGKILTTPAQSAQLGLYLMTQDGEQTSKKYKTDSEAIIAHKKGEINSTDLVKIDGVETTVGRTLINHVLPPKQRNSSIMLDKKKTQKILEELARNSPKEAPGVAEKLKELGFRAAYESGFSIGLDDFEVNDKVRDPILTRTEVEIRKIHSQKLTDREKDEKIEVALLKGQGELQEEVKKTSRHNNLATMVHAGARGDWGQVQQMVSAPVAVEDAMGKIVPHLIGSSYSEGLTPAEYWSAMHGARKGMIERTLRTSEPGALNKSLIHTAINYPITMDDCGTERGVEMDASSHEIVDRYLAQDAGSAARRGDVITPKIATSIIDAGVKKVVVRSPVTCEAPKGICQKCAGMDEYGKEYGLGANLGAISAQSVTEPTTQLTMSTFHTGGIVSGDDKIVDSFRRVKSLMEFPEDFPEKATISERGGKVESITDSPIGGWNVVVGGKTHYVSPDRKMVVKHNEHVEKGARISSGTRDPREVLNVMGVTKMREALVEDLADVYKRSGLTVKRKHFETVARAITDSARIHDPGESDWIPGDVVPYNLIRAENMKNVKDIHVEDAQGAWLAEDVDDMQPEKILTDEDIEKLKKMGITKIKGNPNPIHFDPILKGIRTLPLSRRDWLSQLAFTHLKDALKNGVPEGWKSELHETNPIPGVIYGAEFGMDKKASENGDGSSEAMLARHLSDAGIDV